MADWGDWSSFSDGAGSSALSSAASGAAAGSFLGPIGMMGGAAIGAGINFLSAQSTNAKQMELAQQQMQFQERMSSTAYQRSVADMKAAGLNPAMMFGHGGPETAPSGAMATLTAPKVPENLAQSMASTAAEMAVKDKQIDLMTADIAKREAETATELTMPDLRRASTLLDQQLTKFNEASTAAAKQRVIMNLPEEMKARGITEDSPLYNWIMNHVDRFFDTARKIIPFTNR